MEAVVVSLKMEVRGVCVGQILKALTILVLDVGDRPPVLRLHASYLEEYVEEGNASVPLDIMERCVNRVSIFIFNKFRPDCTSIRQIKDLTETSRSEFNI